MRLRQWSPFLTHLRGSVPDAFAPCYLLLIPDEAERLYLTRKVLSFWPGREITWLSAPCADSTLLEALSSSLFSERGPVVVLQDVEKEKKRDWAFLFQEMEKGSLLLLTAKGKVEGIQEIEKRGVILDFSQEKPWEKKDRVVQFFQMLVQEKKRAIAPEALTLFLDQVGMDFLALETELDKVVCFLGDRPRIERGDLFQVGMKKEEGSAWQIAEDWVWGEGNAEVPSSEAFVPLAIALRSCFLMGMKIGSLLESKEPEENWGAYLPKIWPKTLEKRIAVVRKKGSRYFKRGLEKVLEVEMRARSGGRQEGALLISLFAAAVGHGDR